MHWGLWHTESGNLVETFDTEAGGLQGVRDMLAVNRPDVIDELVLGAMYDEGESQEVELPPVLDGEALKARLAETAQASVADAAREVHERIRRWLTEDGWHITDADDSRTNFDIVAVDQNGWAVRVFQPIDHTGKVILCHDWLATDGLRDLLSRIPEEDMTDILWNIDRDSSLMGVDLFHQDAASALMSFFTEVYLDGFTQDAFAQRLTSLRRSFSLALRRLVRALAMPGRAQEAAEIRRLVQLVPATGGPLTAAS